MIAAIRFWKNVALVACAVTLFSSLHARAGCERKILFYIEQQDHHLQEIDERMIINSVAIVTIPFVIPSGIMNKGKVKRRKEAALQAVELIRDARKVEGERLREVYENSMAKLGGQKTPGQKKMSLEEFASIIREGDEKEVFCQTRIMRIDGIQKWADRVVRAALLAQE
jgi:hypothetical protein